MSEIRHPFSFIYCSTEPTPLLLALPGSGKASPPLRTCHPLQRTVSPSWQLACRESGLDYPAYLLQCKFSCFLINSLQLHHKLAEVKDCIFYTSEYLASSLAYKNYLLNEKIKGVEPRLHPHLKSSAILDISQLTTVLSTIFTMNVSRFWSFKPKNTYNDK